jgi:pyruvate/2-oxoglutarate dehydrogenase complex dihydrolipoamide dehydrogenase (E3) component
MSVALAERKNLGGSCVNFGCTPTQAVIASARVAHQARRAPEYGLEIPEVRVDFPAVLWRAKEIVDLKRGGLEKGLENSDNPTLIRGHARFEGREDEGFRLRVGERSVLARQVVLDTGTRTLLPPIEGMDEVDYIDSGNWLELVHVYVDLINAGATLDVLRNAVHIHPTLAEDIQSAVF